MKIHIHNCRGVADAILIYGAHLNPNYDELMFHDTCGWCTYDDEKTRIRFKLPLGKSSFTYDDVGITVEYTQVGDVVGCGGGPDIYPIVTLEADADQDFFNKLGRDARIFYNSAKNKSEIITFIHCQGHWQRLSRLPKRSLDTIYLPKKLLPTITKDVESFLENKELYRRLCVPYKRNYLFEGIPGTGKTSLIYALASKFDKNIAIMNFNLDVDDATFMKAISRLPDDCILVLEDIDTLFVERKEGDSNKSMISFSGLLNTLDGIAHKEEQMTFLTTNYITKLDKALIRPGRIDKIIKFTYATLSQIEMMYNKFFPDKKSSWKEFKKQIKGIKTTISTFQSFFFSHLDNHLIEHIDELKKMVSESKTENKKLYL